MAFMKVEFSNSSDFVVPCFNSDKFIEECITSLVTVRNFHGSFIFVDDCSTDRTSSIIQKWMNLDSRVKYYKTVANCGISSALNFGIQQSDADIIFRLDSDDNVLPGRVDAQLSQFKDQNCVLCAGGVEKINSNSEIYGAKNGIHLPSSCVKYLFKLGNYFVHSSVALKKSAFYEAGQYSVRMCGVEDYDLWLRIMKIGMVSSVKNQIVQYRSHDSQITSQYSFNRRMLSMLSCSFHECVDRPMSIDSLSDKCWSELTEVSCRQIKNSRLPNTWQRIGNPHNENNSFVKLLKIQATLGKLMLSVKLTKDVKRVLSNHKYI